MYHKRISVNIYPFLCYIKLATVVEGNIYIYIYIYMCVCVCVYTDKILTSWMCFGLSRLRVPVMLLDCTKWCYIPINSCKITGLMSRLFGNGPGDRGSILSRVILKTQKWYLIPPCLTRSTIRWGSRVKWSNLRNGVTPSPTPRFSSDWKGSLRPPPTKVANFTF